MHTLECMLTSSGDVDESAAFTVSLDDLTTEAGGEASLAYDLRSTTELVELMNRADRVVPEAVAGARDELATAIDAVVGQLQRRGRGRVRVHLLDASRARRGRRGRRHPGLSARAGGG
jgi:hypothetical protein